jgi:Carboxypeptidase regulatory-like domain
MARGHCCAASIVIGIMASLTPINADTNSKSDSVQGLITGADGKPLVHAEVRAERTDAVAKRVVTQTDDKGHYVFTSLPTGKYSITVVPERSSQQAAAATATVTAGNGQPVRRFISPLPYQVKADYRSGLPANVRGRYVWKEGETGSHIGGRWIKAADAADPSTNPLQKLNGADFSTAPFLRLNAFVK